MTEELKQNVTIGDVEFELRLDRRAFYLLEREFGADRTAFWYYEQLLTGAISPLVELIWAGIRHDARSKRITPLTIADQFGHDDMEGFSEAQNAVAEAFNPHMQKVIESVNRKAGVTPEEEAAEEEAGNE